MRSTLSILPSLGLAVGGGTPRRLKEDAPARGAGAVVARVVRVVLGMRDVEAAEAAAGGRLAAGGGPRLVVLLVVLAVPADLRAAVLAAREAERVVVLAAKDDAAAALDVMVPDVFRVVCGTKPPLALRPPDVDAARLPPDTVRLAGMMGDEGVLRLLSAMDGARGMPDLRGDMSLGRRLALGFCRG